MPPSHSGAIAQLASGRAGRGLGAGWEARGAARGEVSDPVIEAFPSAIALSKQCQRGARWGQAEIRKGIGLSEGDVRRKAAFSQDGGYPVHLKRDGSCISQGCSAKPFRQSPRDLYKSSS